MLSCYLKKRRTDKSSSKLWSNLAIDRTYFYPGIVGRESNFNHIEKSFKPSPHHTTDTLRQSKGPQEGGKTKNFYPSEEREGGRAMKFSKLMTLFMEQEVQARRNWSISMHYSLHFNSKKTKSREYETSLSRKSKRNTRTEPSIYVSGISQSVKTPSRNQLKHSRIICIQQSLSLPPIIFSS